MGPLFRSRSVCAVSVMDDSERDIALDADGMCRHVRLARDGTSASMAPQANTALQGGAA